MLEFVDAIERAGLDPHSLILARRDTVAAAGWWHPYGPDEIALLYSLSKSFTSTAIGFAEAEGLVDLDRPLVDYFPEAAARAHPRSRDILVRHLLSMATGHENDTLDRLDRDDPVGSFLAVPPDAAPGTLFTYNNGATLMLSMIITELTGQRMQDYLRPRLWRPLGIERAYWDFAFATRQDQPAGRLPSPDLGFSGLHLTTGAIAKFGLTYLSGGSFRGRQVLPPGWVDRATAVHIDNADRHNTPDWQQGYGFQFWRARHGYRGDGAFGQFCVVLPEQQMVLAATCATEDLHGYVSLVWQILLPALADRPLPADPGAAQALADRLAGLALPTPPMGGAGGPGGPATVRLTGEPAVTLGLTTARLERAGEGWQLTLADAAREYPLPCRPAEFTRTEHAIGDDVLVLASAGGWDAAGRFVADVVLLNTPHRFRLTCEPRAGTDVTDVTAVTAWHTAPLHDQPLMNHALPGDVGVA
ncbi:MAG TPA: serine hydrolase [Nakamurella sp.]|nr:serine hydrolase [Nakamurella sp.]